MKPLPSQVKPSVAVHFGIAASYVVPALVVTFGFWWFGSGVAELGDLALGLGLAVGVLVLLTGGLMHENYVRRRKQARMAHEITTLKEAYGEVVGELRQIRSAAFRVGGQPLFGPGAAIGPDAGEVGAEVNALQMLLERVTKDRSVEQWEAAMVRAQTAGRDLTPEQRTARRALLGGLDERKVLAAVDDALKNDRIDLYLQPMVRMPSRRRAAFECSCRIRLPNGKTLTAEQYGLVAEDAGLMGYVQNLLLVRTVQLVRQSLRRNVDTTFFCAFAPHTLMERGFLAAFVQQMEMTAGLSQRLVFGVPQGVLPLLTDDAQRALFRLAAAGFKFYVDDVQTLSADVEDLSARRFRFVKVPAPLLLVTQQQQPDRDPRNMKRLLDRYAIDLIVSGIDSDATMLDLLDFDLDYGMGPFFGEPKPAVADPGTDPEADLAPDPEPAAELPGAAGAAGREGDRTGSGGPTAGDPPIRAIR